MTYAELVWHLIEKLQEKEKELNQAIEIIQKNNISLDSQKQDEAKQLKECIALPRYAKKKKKKKLSATTHLVDSFMTFAT